MTTNRNSAPRRARPAPKRTTEPEDRHPTSPGALPKESSAIVKMAGDLAGARRDPAELRARVEALGHVLVERPRVDVDDQEFGLYILDPAGARFVITPTGHGQKEDLREVESWCDNRSTKAEPADAERKGGNRQQLDPATLLNAIRDELHPGDGSENDNEGFVRGLARAAERADRLVRELAGMPEKTTSEERHLHADTVTEIKDEHPQADERELKIRVAIRESMPMTPDEEDAMHDKIAAAIGPFDASTNHGAETPLELMYGVRALAHVLFTELGMGERNLCAETLCGLVTLLERDADRAVKCLE